MVSRQVYSVLLAVAAFFCAAQSWAKLKYEPSDYAAQDALVLQLDGIRNVGANRAHNPNASTWTDLSGNVGVLTLIKREASDASAWTDNGYLFAGMTYGITAEALPEMANLTIEMWEASTGTWSAPVLHTGDSYTASEGTKVRLTWKWEPDGMVIVIH